MPYYIPRNTKGEGRILYIFSTKGLIYTVAGALVGLPIYLILKAFGTSMVGLVVVAIFAVIGFIIGTVKMPNIKSFEFTKKVSGMNIDEVIMTAIKFRKNKKIYLYNTKEELKDE